MVTWDTAEELFDRAMAQQMIPGFAAAAGRGDKTQWQSVKGMAVTHGAEPRPLGAEDWFDLASLTKVMATLPALLILAAHGQLSFKDSVTQYFPNWDARWKSVTLQHLLTHTGGLASHREYFANRRGLQEYLEAISEEPFECESGTEVIYSDLGYIVLGAIVERVAGCSLSEFTTKAVFTPLNMQAGFCPKPPLQTRCVATEVIRNQALIGVVHDENARALGGIAGHAGLFAPLEAVVRYVKSWVSEGQSLFTEPVRQAATHLCTPHLNGRRAWGWALREDGYDVGGDFWPLTGAGHTGFTGTSIQFDLPSGLWAVLLTNRVHFGRDTNINGLRRSFHNIVVQAAR
ncbi:MAG: serine hydrolase [Sulfobacillus acidophilus]|uniref:Serine hydrolase n=1 Tax=Sulfobacillus acidophilus TaxID=53633 RepID=A0A2T2WJX8_9FIRM|nr:MAG: serine hydrolase [Sulfobacillus acidophilus]